MCEQYFREEVYSKGYDTPVHICVTYCNGHFEGETEAHDEFQILYMQKGSAVFLVNGQKFVLGEGQALIIRSGMFHSQFPLEAKYCQYVIILVDYRFLYSEGMDMIRTHYILPIAAGKLQIPIFISEASAAGKEVLELIEEIVRDYNQETPHWELKLRSILYQFIYNLIKCEERKSIPETESAAQRIERAVSYLHANPVAKTSVEELAVMTCMSRESFYRHFRREMDCTPVEYMTDLKLQQAIALLEHSSLSIKAIADETGFSSANYMIRVFSRKKGITPEQYRKKMQRYR